MTENISVMIGQVTELTLITPIKEGHAGQLRQILQNIQLNKDSPIKKISTIHYARWVLIDNDTRLLFTSNFDGTWEQYLQDFATHEPNGLNAIWGNCVGFPGVSPFEPFAAYVRQHQVKVDLYYAAYPTATVKQVIKALDWEAKTLAFQRELAKRPDPGVGQVPDETPAPAPIPAPESGNGQ